MSDPNDLEARRRAIRLPVRELAAEVGLDEHTVHRVLKTGSGLNKSTRKLANGIEQEERRLLAHLQNLHPNVEAAE